MGNLKALITLHMDHHENNRLSGTLPATIGQCLYLEELIINGHGLTGTIPDSLQRLKSLRLLHLDENSLTGTIPDFFTNFSSLEELHLAKNRLSGTVPEGLDSMTSLHALDLNGNPKLEGHVPDMGPGFKEQADKLAGDLSGDFMSEMTGSVDAAPAHEAAGGHDGSEL